MSELLCILTSFWVLRAPESGSKTFFQPFPTFSVNQPKNDDFEVPPQGVDQLLLLSQLWRKKTRSFSDVFYLFQGWNHWKRFKMNIKVWNGWKKYFDQLLCARSIRKLVEIYNSQSLYSDWKVEAEISSNLFILMWSLIQFICHLIVSQVHPLARILTKYPVKVKLPKKF